MTKQEFAKAINALLPDALKLKLQAIPLPVKAAGEPPEQPQKAAPYMANVTGGQPIYVDISDDGLPGIDANDAVYSDAALTVPYPDGTYTLDDGSTVIIASGKVTTYTPASTPPSMPAAMKAEFAAQKIEFATVLTKFAAMEKETKENKSAITELTKINAVFAEAFKAITETPVQDKSKTDDKFSKQISLSEFKKLENWDKATYKSIWGTPSK